MSGTIEPEPAPETAETGAVFRLLHRFSAAGVVLGGVALIAITAIVAYDVTVRFFGHPTIWATEICGYLLIAVAVLGAGETLRHNEHFAMTLLADALRPGLRRLLGFAVWCAVLVFVVGLTWGMIELVANSLRYDLRSYTILQAPLVLPQLVLVLGFAALAAALFGRVVATWRRTSRNDPSDPTAGSAR